MFEITIKQLLEAGVHFGHPTKKWNPKMAEYIFTQRNGIHIVDLQKTVKKFEEAYNYVSELAQEGGTILFVGTKKQAADTIKFLYEKISAGEPFAVYDKKFMKSEDLNGDNVPIWTYSQDVKNNYITADLLADMDKILQQFDNEIGILAIGEKKERRITDEVQMEADDACARASTWFESLSDSFDNVNKLFPELGLSFTLKYGGVENVYNAKTDANRSV